MIPDLNELLRVLAAALPTVPDEGEDVSVFVPLVHAETRNGRVYDVGSVRRNNFGDVVLMLNEPAVTR